MRKILIVCLLLYCLGIAVIYLDSYPVFSGQTEAAIVFGNTVHENGLPSARLKARLDAAIELVNAKSVDSIIVSGGIGREGHDEAAVMATYLIAQGVPEQHIIVDSQGNNTAQTSQNAGKRLGKTAGVVAVTQQYHISRAKLALRQAGFSEVHGYFPKFYEVRDIYASFREVPAWIVYWLKGRVTAP